MLFAVGSHNLRVRNVVRANGGGWAEEWVGGRVGGLLGGSVDWRVVWRVEEFCVLVSLRLHLPYYALVAWKDVRSTIGRTTRTMSQVVVAMNTDDDHRRW